MYDPFGLIELAGVPLARHFLKEALTQELATHALTDDEDFSAHEPENPEPDEDDEEQPDLNHTAKKRHLIE